MDDLEPKIEALKAGLCDVDGKVADLAQGIKRLKSELNEARASKEALELKQCLINSEREKADLEATIAKLTSDKASIEKELTEEKHAHQEVVPL